MLKLVSAFGHSFESDSTNQCLVGAISAMSLHDSQQAEDHFSMYSHAALSLLSQTISEAQRPKPCRVKKASPGHCQISAICACQPCCCARLMIGSGMNVLVRLAALGPALCPGAASLLQNTPVLFSWHQTNQACTSEWLLPFLQVCSIAA